MSDIYLGNPNLKKVNTPQEFTKEHIEEFLKCKKDPVYFTEKHIKIVNQGFNGGRTKFSKNSKGRI